MTKTLITDDFDLGAPRGNTVHNIVYGRDGWTDSLDDDVLTTLLAAGVIALHEVIRHNEGETRRYVSRGGFIRG